MGDLSFYFCKYRWTDATCCSSWTHVSLWSLMRFILGYRKSWLISLWDLSSLFFRGLGDWRGSNWLKAGKCCPVFKKGKKEDPGNYRPVSLIWVPAKIIVKVILGVTEKDLRDIAVIGHRQHSFMRGKPHFSNLSLFYDKFIHLVEQRKPVDVVGLDFSNTFDTVSHSILLVKCPAHSWKSLYFVWAIGWWVGLQRIIVNEVTSGW